MLNVDVKALNLPCGHEHYGNFLAAQLQILSDTLLERHKLEISQVVVSASNGLECMVPSSAPTWSRRLTDGSKTTWDDPCSSQLVSHDSSTKTPSDPYSLQPAKLVSPDLAVHDLSSDLKPIEQCHEQSHEDAQLSPQTQPDDHVLAQSGETPEERWAVLTTGILQKYASKPMHIERAWLKMLDSWVRYGRLCVPPEGSARAPDRTNTKLWTTVHGDGHKSSTFAYAGQLLTDSRGWFRAIALHPHSSVRMAWVVIGMILIGWDLLTLPFQFFELGHTADQVLTIMDKMTFGFWFLDVLLSFTIGVERAEGIDMRLKTIASVYIKSWFLLDASLLIFDILLFLLEATFTSSLQSVRVIRGLRLLRAFRLLRLWRLQRALHVLSRNITSVNFWITMNILGNLAIMLAMNHYVAVAWLYLAWDSDGISWMSIYSDGDDLSTAYVLALHWALTQFLPSTNNIAPAVWSERLFAICVVLSAFAGISALVSGMANSINALRSLGVNGVQEEVMLRQFCAEWRISGDLLAQIRQTHAKMNATVKNRLLQSEIKMIQRMPQTLMMSLHEQMHRETIISISCFSTWITSSQYRDLVLKCCHLAIDEKIVLTSQIVFLPDDECMCAMHVTSGTLSYHTATMPHDDDAGIEVCADQWISEIRLFAYWFHRGKLASQGTSHYVCLDPDTFARLIRDAGGTVYAKVRQYGMMVVSYVEDRDSSFHKHMMHSWDDPGEVHEVTDLGLDTEEIGRIRQQADQFVSQLQSDHGVEFAQMFSQGRYSQIRV